MMCSCLVDRLSELALLACFCLIVPGCSSSKISKTNADRVNIGMSEKEVSDILGSPYATQEVNMPDIGGFPGGDMPGMPKMPKGMKQCVWKEGLKVITVTFIDGKVSGKTVAGF